MILIVPFVHGSLGQICYPHDNLFDNTNIEIFSSFLCTTHAIRHPRYAPQTSTQVEVLHSHCHVPDVKLRREKYGGRTDGLHETIGQLESCSEQHPPFPAHLRVYLVSTKCIVRVSWSWLFLFYALCSKF